MLLAPSVAALFKWRQFEPEVILLAVGWYLRFSLSYRDVEELLADRGLSVDHGGLFYARSIPPETTQTRRTCFCLRRQYQLRTGWPAGPFCLKLHNDLALSCSATPRQWNDVCAGDSNRPTAVVAAFAARWMAYRASGE